MKTICVIPARYASTRLPGKPLKKIGDKPMIQWVYERARSASRIDRILVATDDTRIAGVVRDFGGEAVMTDPELASGSDRVAAAVSGIDADVIINLQGDEPFVEPKLLTDLSDLFRNKSIYMATPVKRIKSYEELISPDLVRVVRDTSNNALYFTRSVIPFLREIEDKKNWISEFPYYKHVGIYAYRKEFLLELTKLPASALEKAEKLEQLRVLENGFNIHVLETDYESISVDTPEDLEFANKIIKNRS